MNALRTMEDAVKTPFAPTHLTASSVPVFLDTPAMVLHAQVRHYYHPLVGFAWLGLLTCKILDKYP